MQQQPPRQRGGTGAQATHSPAEATWGQEAQALDAILASLAESSISPETWDNVFSDAQSSDRLSHMAFAFEQVAQGPRLKASQPWIGAEFLFHAGRFFNDVLGDPTAAASYFERALAASRQALAAGLVDVEAKKRVLSRVVELYSERLLEPERALPYAEQLLVLEPTHEKAREVAQKLIVVKGLAGRAASALAAAYEVSGSPEQVAHYLSIELESTRGPKRASVLARLGRLKQEHLGDELGAYQAYEQAMSGEPDDDLRSRYVGLAIKLNRLAEASKTLGRVLATTKDSSARAKTTAQLGTVLLHAGDVRRAKGMLSGVLEAEDSPPEAVLTAGHALLEILEKERDTRALCDVLERIAVLEPDLQRRQSIDERLSEIALRLGNPARAIPAFERLLSTEARARALEALEPLYETGGDPVRRARLLQERARDLSDPKEARALMMRAANVLANDTKDTSLAIACCQEIIERFGAAADVLEVLIPLLNAGRMWPELAAALTQQSKLVPPAAQSPILARLGLLRWQRLQDVPAAIAAMREALALDPQEKTARSTLERLVSVGDHRLAAAAALEPVYRAEGATPQLVRLLELRGSLEQDVAARLDALREAVDLSVGSATDDPARALELLGLGLRTAAEQRRPLRDWFDRLERIAGPEASGEQQATILSTAVGNPDAALAVAQEAMGQEGDPRSRAILEELYAKSGRHSDLFALLEGGLAGLDDATGRALRARLARLAAEQGDSDRARVHSNRLLDDPGLSLDQLEAVEYAAEKLDDVDIARTALKRRVDLADSTGAQIAGLVRLGELDLSRRGDPAGAAESWRHAAEVAEGAGDDETALWLYSRVRNLSPNDGECIARLVVLSERAERWTELPDLYDALAAQTVEGSSRAELALRSARVLSEKIGDQQRALQQAAQAFSLSPDRVDALEVFERLSTETGNIDSFERAVGAALSAPRSASPLDAARRGRLALALASALASHPERFDDAARMYRAILEGEDLDGTSRDAALGSFEALLARDHDNPSRRADGRWVLEWRASHCPPEERATRLLEWARQEELTFLDPQKALELHKQVLQFDPNCGESLYSVARLALATGEVHQALEALRAHRDGADGATRMAAERELARALVAHAELMSEALPSLRAVLSAAPDDVEALAMTARLLTSASASAEAISVLEQAYEATSNTETRVRILASLIDESTTSDPERRGIWFERLTDLQSEHDRAETALATAVRAARELPTEPRRWDRAEALARRVSKPDEIAEAYQEALARTPSPQDGVAIAERAVHFFEEWFDDPSRVTRILERTLEIDPTAVWAFDRLKLELDKAERWEELFALYDRTLTTAPDAERATLLDEAAQTAKDFANQPDRAIGYLERLRELRPSDRKIASSLERLYERQGRHRELVALLTSRLPALEGAEERRTRVRAATLWLQAIGDPQASFDMVAPLLGPDNEVPKDCASDVWALMESILLASPADVPHAATSAKPSNAPPPSRPGRRRRRAAVSAPPQEVSLRRRVAAHLRDHYGATARNQDLVRILLVELDTMTQPAERLPQLARLAGLSESVGDLPAAMEHTGLAVIAAPHDVALRSQLDSLAQRAGRLDRLTEILALAAQGADDPSLRAQLTMEAATLRAERLDDVSGAIELLSAVLEDERVSNHDLLAIARQLDGLFERGGLTANRIPVLERIAALETDVAARREAIGRAAHLAEATTESARAIALWEQRLASDEQDIEALDRLIVLLEQAQNYERLTHVLGLRAAVRAEGQPRRREDLVRIAALQADFLARPEEAFSTWRAIEQELGETEESMRALTVLARSTERWKELAELLERNVAHDTEPEARATRLSELGDLNRERFSDDQGALSAYSRALRENPHNQRARLGLYAVATGAERSLSAQAVISMLHSLGKDPNADAIVELAPSGTAADAETLLRTALEVDPVNEDLLSAMVQLQRRRPDRELLASLTALSDAKGGDLALLREACEVALNPVNDEMVAIGLAEKALEGAKARWSEEARGFAGWAIETLVRLHQNVGNAEAMYQVLRTGEALPFEKETQLAMRRRAARAALDQLNDSERATELYAALFAHDPRDAEAIEKLVAAYEAGGRTRELLSLRERQVQVAETVDERIALRLETSRLLIALGEVSQGIESLRANLSDNPRHVETVANLATALSATGRHQEPLEHLCAQAQLAEDAGETRAAADFWARAAECAEENLADRSAAETYHKRVTSLEPRPTSLDALARLANLRGDSKAAADWLERLLEAAPEQLVATTLRLADALVASGRVDRAAQRIEASLALAPEADSLHLRIASLYRDRGEWGKLAKALALAATHSSDSAARQSRLMQASQLFLEKCGEPESAIPLLQQASELAPAEAGVRLVLADALSRADRRDEALSLLRSMIESFGGRRPPERAQLHHRVARLLIANGDRAGALVELDAASRMDPQNAEVLGALAAIARDDSQLERAEKSYRALLAVLRRRGAALSPADITRGEVLLELRDIANRRGESDRANELLESALEAGTQSKLEEERLAAALRDRGEYETLIRVLEMTLERPAGSVEAVASIIELSDLLAERLGKSPQMLNLLTELKGRAESAAEPEAARRLRFAVARLADKLGDLALSAATLEDLHRADPADREAWEPLADVYRRAGETTKLVELLTSIVNYVDDAKQRARLRLERAKLLMSRSGIEDAQAELLLREVLDDDPHQDEAATVLAEILERTGKSDALVELLTKQVEWAKDAGDASQVASRALRLGSLLEATDRVQARNLYYTGLDWDSANRGLLDALARLLEGADTTERADILERRLALEQGPQAEATAMALWGMRNDAGDHDAAERALLLGHRGYPASTALREKLEEAYRNRQDWRKLAAMLEMELPESEDSSSRVSRLRRAAVIYRDDLADPASAARALAAARAAAPDDLSLVSDHIDALMRDGDRNSAIAELNRAIDGKEDNPTDRAALLASRAGLRESAGDGDGALEDLESAFAIDREIYGAALAAHLSHAVAAAEQSGDRVRVRKLRVRQAHVLPYTGDVEGARAILVDLIQEDPETTRALAPTDPWDVCLLADAYLVSGRASEALALLQPLIAPYKGKRVRELAPIHSRIARGAAELGDTAGEVYALVQALECDPQNADISSEVGQRALELGELELASRAFRAVTLTKTPGPVSRALAFQYLGEIARRQGDTKRALGLFKRALAEDPDLESARALVDAIEPRG